MQCTAATKQVLLQGLSNELSELSASDTASIASIERCTDTVDQVAQELQATISLNEVQQMKAKNRKRMILAAGSVIALALTMLLIAVLVFTNGPFYIIESIREI